MEADPAASSESISQDASIFCGFQNHIYVLSSILNLKVSYCNIKYKFIYSQNMMIAKNEFIDGIEYSLLPFKIRK